ncbi:uncharacterized protein LOC108193722 isoform X2 [Daucus carota subsp. sativus]
MYDFVQSKKKPKFVQQEEEDYDEDVEEVPSTAASNTLGSSKSSAKSKGKGVASPFHFKKPMASSKSVASMLMRSPEQVIEERHMNGPSQTTLESKLRTKEEKDRVSKHIADFFYENGIPFNAANSRSYEIMVESIGQYGPGLKPPTFHDLRLPLLKKAKEETSKLREKHEKAWKKYGCTLMTDGWTDRRGRHLINFLANSPEGTFFLQSFDASSESHDAEMLSSLINAMIIDVGIPNVVQVVTDNGANYKLAGAHLEELYPTLFWTPCAAHCLDLMLEDVGKLPNIKKVINQARRCTTFIYRHGRVLQAMREHTNGMDLVRTGATRFATAFLTLQRLHKLRPALRKLFGSEYWIVSKLSKTENGRRVYEIVFSIAFWEGLEDCLNASQPLLQVLRIADGDERPALAEVAAAMDYARVQFTKAFVGQKTQLRNKVLKIIDDRWNTQMGKPLYGAALFLNPGKYFDIVERNPSCASRIREDFNDVLEKMVKDRTTRNLISNSADDYKNTRGGFAREMAIEHRKEKSPLDWWDAYGGRAIELQSFAKRIVGLCCSSSGCERNWSTFEFIHTKKRNRLEHLRLNDLVYVQYNRKIDSRFKKMRELGEKYNPLIFEDLEWTNDWMNDIEDRFWSAVDIASGASQGLEGRTLPRKAKGGSTSDMRTYTRRGTSSTLHDDDDDDDDGWGEDEDHTPIDDMEVEDDYGVPPDPSLKNTQEGDEDFMLD